MKFKLSAVTCAVLLLAGVLPMRAHAEPTSPQAAPQASADQEPVFSVSGFEVQGPELVPRDQVMSVLSAYASREIS